MSLRCTSSRRLRTTDSGRGAVTRLDSLWHLSLEPPGLEAIEGVVSQALMAMDLKQHSGDMVILNNSAGAVAQNWENFSRTDVTLAQLYSSNCAKCALLVNTWNDIQEFDRGRYRQIARVNVLLCYIIIHNCKTVLVKCELLLRPRNHFCGKLGHGRCNPTGTL